MFENIGTIIAVITAIAGSGLIKLIVALVKDVKELKDEIDKSTGKDSPGGKNITEKEKDAIIKRTIDALDSIYKAGTTIAGLWKQIFNRKKK